MRVERLMRGVSALGAGTPRLRRWASLDAWTPEAMELALGGRSPRYVVEHRVRRHDGGTLWIQSEGRVVEPLRTALSALGIGAAVGEYGLGGGFWTVLAAALATGGAIAGTSIAPPLEPVGAGHGRLRLGQIRVRSPLGSSLSRPVQR